MIYFDDNHLLIAKNNSYWNWEYDNMTINANLILNINSGKLFLDLVKTHVKTGLGAGKTTTKIGKFEVGTLGKPKKREIVSILSKHKLDRPFPRNGWYINGYDDKPGRHEMSLSDAITNFKESRGVSMVLKLNKIKKLLKN